MYSFDERNSGLDDTKFFYIAKRRETITIEIRIASHITVKLQKYNVCLDQSTTTALTEWNHIDKCTEAPIASILFAHN